MQQLYMFSLLTDLHVTHKDLAFTGEKKQKTPTDVKTFIQKYKVYRFSI